MTPSTIALTLQSASAAVAAGRLAEAESLCRQVLQASPNHPDALIVLGNTLYKAARWPEAADAYRTSLAIRPGPAEIYDNLGMCLNKYGRIEPAIEAFREALKRSPNDLYAGNNLGNAFQAIGRFSEAIDVFRNVIATHPNSANAHSNLANVFFQTGDLDASIAEFRLALYWNPTLAEAHTGLGGALKDSGQIESALASFRTAIEAKPQLISAHSNFLYSLYFHPAYDNAAILREHQKLDAAHAAPLVKESGMGGPPMSSAENHGRAARATESNRRLRIGYVSPVFRHHSMSFFTLPLLEAHDHRQFEIFCYGDLPKPDEMTEKICARADVWRDIFGLSDAQVADQIVADGMDILVDLTLHMAHGRPMLFARKPAPIQVAWLAYPGTTGISAMDYRLTDPYLDPPGETDQFYLERSIRLPDSVACYDPLATDPPVNALPVLSNGHITFGCLNNFCKVNGPVLEMWSAVLAAVPNSRMLILAPPGSARKRTIEKFTANGISADRIEFLDRRDRPEYLELYHRIDIALDTVPYNGHTTSLDALWMGVPIVTLRGQTAAGRLGLSLLANLGLTEWVADSPEQFAQIAAALSEHRTRLSDLRSTLRQRLERSPLMDKKRFAANIEKAYREMWAEMVRQEAS